MLWTALAAAAVLAPPLAAQEISSKELGRKALETAVEHSRSADSDVRAMAADALGETGNKSAAAFLKKLLADADKHVRIAAGEALWKLGDRSGLPAIAAMIEDVPAQGPVGNTALVELKIISQNKIREHAIEAYARMRGEKAADLLYKLKNDAYDSIRDAAARELSRLGYEAELEPFLAALESDDEAIRYAGAKVFSEICSPAAVSPLAALLGRESSARVKAAALDALKCTEGRKAALAELLKHADDPNPTLQFKAVGALSATAERRAFEKLKGLYAASKDLTLKVAMVRGLMSGGQQPDKDLLDLAFASASPDVKLEALKVIERLPEEQAKPYLRDCLGDTAVNVKLAAALQVLKRFAKKK